jgi:hypothetical protein
MADSPEWSLSIKAIIVAIEANEPAVSSKENGLVCVLRYSGEQRMGCK